MEYYLHIEDTEPKEDDSFVAISIIGHTFVTEDEDDVFITNSFALAYQVAAKKGLRVKLV